MGCAVVSDDGLIISLDDCYYFENTFDTPENGLLKFGGAGAKIRKFSALSSQIIFAHWR